LAGFVSGYWFLGWYIFSSYVSFREGKGFEFSWFFDNLKLPGKNLFGFDSHLFLMALPIFN